jgi:hypothetical protein
MGFDLGARRIFTEAKLQHNICAQALRVKNPSVGAGVIRSLISLGQISGRKPSKLPGPPDRPSVPLGESHGEHTARQAPPSTGNCNYWVLNRYVRSKLRSLTPNFRNESVCTFVGNATEGSNPSLSATQS